MKGATVAKDLENLAKTGFTGQSEARSAAYERNGADRQSDTGYVSCSVDASIFGVR